LSSRCCILRRSEIRAKIRERLASGQAPAKIAADLGVARSTVYRIKGKVPPRKGDRAAYATVYTRLTEAELRAFDRLAEANDGMSRAALLRRLVRFAGDFAAPTPDEEVFLRSAERHLSRLGGNFNQIAASLSVSVKKIGRADPTQQQIEALHRAEDDIDEIRAMVRQILENWQAKSRTFAEQLATPEAYESVDDE